MASNTNNSTTTPRKPNPPPKGNKISVSDFVSSSFARFEAEYGPSTFVEVSAGTEASRLLASRHNKNNGKIINDKEHDEDEEEYEDDEPFWSLLLTLYFPLLVFGLRRSTFGTFSFIRTFLLGHVLRLLITVILFSIPTSFSDRFDKWWGKITQIVWVQHILWAVTGEERFHPNNQQIGHYSQCFEGVNHAAASAVGSRKHPDQVWPPPALTLLTFITVVAFVVHPDGLTWIVMGKVFEGVVYLFKLLTDVLVMFRDEPIHTIAAAASLAGILLLGGVIHRTLSPKTNRSGEGAGPGGSSRKTKKGKKGRHGRHSNHTARGRAKVRGGHFRSAKDLYESPTRQRSRSRSASLPRLDDTQQNPCEISDTKEPAVPKDASGDSHNNSSKKGVEGNIKKCVESSSAHSQSQPHNPVTKLRPYSVDSSVPQLSDDVSSCSSITGSLIDVPGSKPLKSVLADADKKSSRRKNKQNQKRGKNPVAAGTHQSNNAASTSRVPPGFIANDPTMTPSRVSPLTLSNPTPSPSKANYQVSALISPVQKAISRPPPHNKMASNAVGNRTRASTSDGVVKHPHTAPIPITRPSNIAPIGKSSTHMQQPINHPPGIVRYGLPDYSAYAQSDGRYDPKKIELAAFLARVGLVGSACADLLRDLFDVDALAALTAEQLYMYNVGDEKQMEIAALLKARELRLLQQRMQKMPPPLPATTPAIRPPPGLGFASPAPAFESGVATLQTNPVQPINRPLTHAHSFAPDRSSDLLMSPPVTNGNNVPSHFSPVTNNVNPVSSNFSFQSLRSSVDNSMSTGNVTDPLMQSSFHQNQAAHQQQPPIGSRLYALNNRQVEPIQTYEEKIDADLQQLGDRMAGSILDF